ncbi:MAG: cupin domain-containing protein [Thaumarchaeota archaeon]|nr:cupin domain-containing protein [Nitrososphaerota archaeon]
MSSPAKGTENDYNSAGFWSDKAESWHDFMPGVRRRILVNNSAATAALYKMNRGAEVPLHSHPQAQYGVCIEGAGVFKVGDKSWTMKKGDSYYIPPSVIHGLKIDPNADTTLVEFFTPIRRDFLKDTWPADGPT